MKTSQLLNLLAAVTSLASAAVSHETINVLVSRAPPTCRGIPRSPFPAGFHCNEAGVVARPATFMAPMMKPSLETCRDACVNHQGRRSCVSFSWQKSNKQCTLYSATIDSMGFTPGRSGIIFSNYHCYSRACDVCPSNQSLCGQNCTAPESDAANCGNCGTTCADGASCSNGACLCPPGKASCDNECRDNSANCGRCGPTCDGADGNNPCNEGQCTCPNIFPPNGYQYGLFFQSTGGVVENPDNPGNQDANFPARTFTYDGALTACQAITACAQRANSLVYTGPGGFNHQYYSFNLYRTLSSGMWKCVAFYHANRDQSYYSMVDVDAGEGYLYSVYDPYY